VNLVLWRNPLQFTIRFAMITQLQPTFRRFELDGILTFERFHISATARLHFNIVRWPFR